MSKDDIVEVEYQEIVKDDFHWESIKSEVEKKLFHVEIFHRDIDVYSYKSISSIKHDLRCKLYRKLYIPTHLEIIVDYEKWSFLIFGLSEQKHHKELIVGIAKKFFDKKLKLSFDLFKVQSNNF